MQFVQNISFKKSTEEWNNSKVVKKFKKLPKYLPFCQGQGNDGTMDAQ